MLALILLLLSAFSSALSLGPSSHNGSTVNVLDFGAIPDGKTDNTHQFQTALNWVSNHWYGGQVIVPAGSFAFSGSLTIPPEVSLIGSYTYSPSHNIGQTSLSKNTKKTHSTFERQSFLVKSALGKVGTVLLAYANKGNPDGPSFISISSNAALFGVVIYYPEQVQTSAPPIQYPYTISMGPNNPSIQNCELLNPFAAIMSNGSARFLISNVMGQPIFRGIVIDRMYDIGRVVNCHFNPWYSGVNNPLYDWQLSNGIAFVVGRADWVYFLNTFAYAYNIGFQFIETGQGSCNGNFLGCGIDNAHTSIQVQAADPYGILFTNGEFTSFTGPNPTHLDVSSTNSGKISFVNSAFWGASNQVALIDGSGTVSFSACTFTNHIQRSQYAIQVSGTGSIQVTNSDFQIDAPQVSTTSSVSKAIVTGNLISTRQQFDVRAEASVVTNNI